MRLAIILIGRNEGARLVRSLAPLKDTDADLIYVDSGSTDDSVAQARKAGARVVELAPDRPFTAARGRNAGFAALGDDLPEYVQFFDGDCVVEPDWIDAGMAALEEDPDLGIVTGWRSEINRDQSVYNAMFDFEWHRPAGEILACSGDMMVRANAFAQTGGFDETVIAAEDDEFSIRLRGKGWKMRRLPINMSRHDADMTEFSAWWRRCVRSGHGFAQVGAMHRGYFAPERKRVLFYGAVLPLLALVSLVVFPVGLLGIGSLYVLSFIRSVRGLTGAGLPLVEAMQHSVFLVISKFPNLIGMGIFYWRRLNSHKMNIIEYK